MFSRPKILFLVSLLFVALLNPKFNPYLLFKFLIFYHSSIGTSSIPEYAVIEKSSSLMVYSSQDKDIATTTGVKAGMFRNLDKNVYDIFESINETAKQKPASNVPVDNVPGYIHTFLIQHLQKLLLTLILVRRHSK